MLLEEEEEGEILMKDQEAIVAERSEEVEVVESDTQEENVLSQRVKEWDKLGVQKGRKRGQKSKAQDPKPSKSSGSSRRKH